MGNSSERAGGSMTDVRSSEVACCAHLKVSYKTEPVGNGAVRGWWECGDCHTKFEPTLASSRKFECGARKAGTAGGNYPQDCDWPFCGCDERATEVIEALQECGWGHLPATKPLPDLARHLARHMAYMIVPESVAASEEKFHAYLAEELPRLMGAQLAVATQERDVALYLLNDIKEKLKAESAAQPDPEKLARETEEMRADYQLVSQGWNSLSYIAHQADEKLFPIIQATAKVLFTHYPAILRTALSAPAMPQENKK